ncbi:MAG TPA: hydantoinase B/oxoprolinase family protein [Steroidobacteraceae bacterium]|nr:hydantoinase B/oxoprolinase family protein [Steroidobacteraceae bacterium]
MHGMQRGWEFWIDRGGTFTDVIGVAPDRTLHVRKVLSASPGAADPGLAAIQSLLAADTSAAGEQASPRAARAPPRITALKVGTTVATNALLERTGEPVLLVTSSGFADGIAIGDQSRPDIFARHIVRPQHLYAEVIEAHERIDASGAILEPLDRAALRGALERAHARGLRAAAVVFLHGWRHPKHEREAAALARAVGFEQVSVSHQVSPLVRYVPRCETTVLDAYLAAKLGHYVARLAHELAALDPQARLELMQSHGGLTAPASFHAASSLLSGPAGGLIGAAHAAGRVGITRLISFDMGGTSTDVSLLDGALPRRFEHHIAGVRVQTSMLDVHTIAAGGGSILRFKDERASVGPDSAGADPGPACYGRGGPLTLTDVQVLLGRLRPDTLPRCFGARGDSCIDRDIVVRRFAALAAEVSAGSPPPSEVLAESYLEVAVASMANAIRRVSVHRGVEPAEFTLMCFGGAAGQHACRVARASGMRRILMHPLASVLSAYGIGVADRSTLLRTSLRMPLDATGLASARALLDELGEQARAALAAGAEPEAKTTLTRVLELRAGDSETALSVPEGPLSAVEAAFASAHRQRFGFAPSGIGVIIESLAVEARYASIEVEQLRMPDARQAALPRTVRVWFGGWTEVPLIASRELTAEISGPALIVEPHSTLVLEAGWKARRLPGGEILAEDLAASDAASRAAASRTAELSPARIEIFNNLFMHIAEQMGEVLRQTAQSVNIKERLDYSCALFDASGGLVANAPHMPVHLGSMGASVRAVIAAHRGQMRTGDAWLLNSPYHGGTHLPDMTVVSPVSIDGDPQSPDFFVASRGHHADIGGISPGSMPSGSARIEQEGVLVEDFRLLERGHLRERELRALLASGPYPARNPDQNVADLRAQLAANARGGSELARAVQVHGLQEVRAAMRDVQANAATSVRNALERLHAGAFRYEMDGGQVIAVRIDIDRATRRARIDFGGTSRAGAHNFNAPRAVCIAAVLYVFRTLVERSIPLNQGCLEPLDIVIPAGSMLDPAAPAAVAAGNVETSQCIVDTLYGALGVLAAACGTMNNLTFGNAHLQYYETIAGGSGAGPHFDGCDAIQTHMTNSRLTDPEILEAKFPVLVRAFRIRRGSGGTGLHRGGDGIERRLQFRAPVSGALLGNRHRVAPFGLAGGSCALPGAARVLRRSGAVEELEATARFVLDSGDELEILTPGGGGYGARGG